MSESKDHKLNVPAFSSTLPDYLLENCSSKEKYMMEMLSRINNQTDCQTQKLVEQSLVIGEVSDKLDYTNGKVRGLLTQGETDKPTIDTVKTIFKLGKNKVVLAGLVFVLFVGIPYIYAHVSVQDIVKIIFAG